MATIAITRTGHIKSSTVNQINILRHVRPGLRNGFRRVDTKSVNTKFDSQDSPK
ncbi:hypothetical protein V2P20_05795 [Methylobacter sp. Wu1]|uniref:hypothetical protein n=1 Tax=Methylobacter sp. Wu1 TaxID=3119359 RepID=UPI002F94319A